MTSTKRTARPARDKYVPSEKQRAEDRAIKDRLDRLTNADLKAFDRVLGKAIKPLLTRTP